MTRREPPPNPVLRADLADAIKALKEGRPVAPGLKPEDQEKVECNAYAAMYIDGIVSRSLEQCDDRPPYGLLGIKTPADLKKRIPPEPLPGHVPKGWRRQQYNQELRFATLETLEVDLAHYLQQQVEIKPQTYRRFETLTPKHDPYEFLFLGLATGTKNFATLVDTAMDISKGSLSKGLELAGNSYPLLARLAKENLGLIAIIQEILKDPQYLHIVTKPGEPPQLAPTPATEERLRMVKKELLKRYPNVTTGSPSLVQFPDVDGKLKDPALKRLFDWYIDNCEKLIK